MAINHYTTPISYHHTVINQWHHPLLTMTFPGVASRSWTDTRTSCGSWTCWKPTTIRSSELPGFTMKRWDEADEALVGESYGRIVMCLAASCCIFGDFHSSKKRFWLVDRMSYQPPFPRRWQGLLTLLRGPLFSLEVAVAAGGYLFDLWLHGIRFARSDPCQYLGRNSQAAGSSETTREVESQVKHHRDPSFHWHRPNHPACGLDSSPRTCGSKLSVWGCADWQRSKAVRYWPTLSSVIAKHYLWLLSTANHWHLVASFD